MGTFTLVTAIFFHPIWSSESNIITFWLFNISLMILFAIVTIINIIAMSYIQTTTRTKLLGKVLDLTVFIASLATPLALLLFGEAIDLLTGNIYIIFIVVAVIALIVSIFTKRIFMVEKKIYN